MKRIKFRKWNYVFIFNLIWLFTAYSQTGPGGVGGGSSPIPNILWLSAGNKIYSDAGSTPAADGQPVQQWNDLSGASYTSNTGQPTLANRPTLQTNELNSQPILQFDGTNDFMNANLGPFPFNNITAFTVGKFSQANQPNNDYDFMYYLGNTSGLDGISLSRAAANDAGGANKYYSHTEGINRRGPQLNNSYRIYTQTFNFSYPYHYMRLNGNTQTVDAHNAQIDIGSSLFLGRSASSSNPHYLNGNLAELIIYSTDLNETQRRIVENYLSSKYAIAIANDRYAYDGVYKHNVCGIGRVSDSDYHDEAQGQNPVRIFNPSSLDNGDYMLWGHDNQALGTNNSDIPATYNPITDGRWDQVWRVDKSNDPGKVSMMFEIWTPIGSDLANYEILIDNDGDFSNGGTVTHTHGRKVHTWGGVEFSNVDLSDGAYFTLGYYHDDHHPYCKPLRIPGSGYYRTYNYRLYIENNEEYSLDPGTHLNYTIYDENHSIVASISEAGSPSPASSPTTEVTYGDNYVELNLSALGLGTGRYYLLEIINRKKEKRYVKFVYEQDIPNN